MRTTCTRCVPIDMQKAWKARLMITFHSLIDFSSIQLVLNISIYQMVSHNTHYWMLYNTRSGWYTPPTARPACSACVWYMEVKSIRKVCEKCAPLVSCLVRATNSLISHSYSLSQKFWHFSSYWNTSWRVLIFSILAVQNNLHFQSILSFWVSRENFCFNQSISRSYQSVCRSRSIDR